MKFLDLTGLQYFYDKYLRPLKDAAFKNTANNLTTETKGSVLDARQGKVLNDLKLSIAKVINNLLTTEEGFALDARQGKVLDDKITELNGKTYELIEYSNGYVKKYNDGTFDSYRITTFESGELSFTVAEGIGYARFTNFGIGITATETTEISGIANNAGIAWLASPSVGTGMDTINGYIAQIGSDNQRSTTLRVHVTGKWK